MEIYRLAKFLFHKSLVILVFLPHLLHFQFKRIFKIFIKDLLNKPSHVQLVWQQLEQKASCEFKNTKFYNEFTDPLDFQDLRFTKIYTAAHKIYGLLWAPRLYILTFQLLKYTLATNFSLYVHGSYRKLLRQFELSQAHPIGYITLHSQLMFRSFQRKTCNTAIQLATPVAICSWQVSQVCTYLAKHKITNVLFKCIIALLYSRYSYIATLLYISYCCLR